MLQSHTVATYLLELGSTPELSWAELESLWGKQIKRIDRQFALWAKPQQPAHELIDILGGTVKIFRVIEKLPLETSNETLEDKLWQILDTGDKIRFFVAEINRAPLPALDLTNIKTKLTQSGHKARYMTGPKRGLSAALLRHKKGIRELAIIHTAQSIFMSETVAVQDIDNWTKRDRGKPFAQRQRGLLTPKVARIMVNLAGLDRQRIIYDPFCGTGTILMEAALLNYPLLLASDLDTQAVKGSQDNLHWLKTNYSVQANSKVFLADATRVKPNPLPDLIVTEPFLGKLRPKPNQITAITKGLGKLYLGMLKNFRSWLKPHSDIIIIFPKFTASNKPSIFDSLIDKLDQLGYTTTLGPITYARPSAVVQRQIVHLKVK